MDPSSLSRCTNHTADRSRFLFLLLKLEQEKSENEEGLKLAALERWMERLLKNCGFVELTLWLDGYSLRMRESLLRI